MFLLCFTVGITRNKPDICPSPWKGLDGFCDLRGDTCQSNADCDQQGGGKCCFNGCQKDCVQFGELDELGRGIVNGFAHYILLIRTPENILVEQNVFYVQILGYLKVIREGYDWHFHTNSVKVKLEEKPCPAAFLSLLQCIPRGLVCPSPCKFLDLSFCRVVCLDFWAALF